MSTLKDIYEIIKEVKSLADKYHNQEIAEKIITIQEKFFDIREEVEEIKDENRNLKQTIEKINADKEIEKDLELNTQGFYIRKTEKSQGKNIMYCAACWENNHKLMPLTGTHKLRPKCCNCQTTYILKDSTNYSRIFL